MPIYFKKIKIIKKIFYCKFIELITLPYSLNAGLENKEYKVPFTKVLT